MDILVTYGFHATTLTSKTPTSDSVLAQVHSHYTSYTSLKDTQGNVTEVKEYECFSIVGRSKLLVHKGYANEVITFIERKGLNVHYKKRKKYTPSKVLIPLKGDKEIRDYQEPLVEALVSMSKGETYSLNIPTGKGKTFTSCAAISKISERAIFYIHSKYIDKWVEDIHELFKIEDGDFYLVQGKDSLTRLFEMDKTELRRIKFFLFSSKTMYNVYKNYDNNEYDLKVKPEKIIEFLDVGVVLMDEIHESFESLNKAIIHLDPPKIIGLTATLHSDRRMIKRAMENLFPTETRLKIQGTNTHASVYSISYSIRNANRLRVKGVMGYSHAEFEKSLMRNRNATLQYFDMLHAFFKAIYLKHREEGDKVLIYIQTLKLGAMLVDYFRKQQPHLQTDLFVGGSDYDIILNSDIIISTIGKSGAALDIPNLITVLQTVVITSTNANTQTIGRLRHIEGKDLNFIYFYCNNIPRHRDNDKLRKRLFPPLSKDIKAIHFPLPIEY
jgi:superfamily II DNA or RNA helicase